MPGKSIYILFFLFTFLLEAQELYKYTDENGVEQIVDSPYKLPANIRDKYIKEYEKKKKNQLPPDLQDTRPAFKDSVKSNMLQEELQRLEEEREKKKAQAEREKRLEELKKEMEEKVKELGYKSQRALITQIPELKAEVERLKARIEELEKEIEKLGEKDSNNNQKQ
ncbi:MAG: hypothetical protein ACP5QK_12990 [Myxococcota bacterium]